MTISLSPEFEQLIQHKVTSGAYASADDVVREALRLLNERDAETPEWKRDVSAKIEEAWQSLRRGEGIDGDEAMVMLHREIDDRAAKRGQ